MTTQLEVWNAAARLVGEPRFDTLNDDVELRYLLDDCYAEAVDYCLTLAPWRFATEERALLMNGTETEAGYDFAFDIPVASLRELAIFASDLSTRTGDLPIDCRLRQGVVFTNFAGTILASYISTVGRDEALWPSQFAETVAAYLAFQVTQRMTALNGRTGDLFSYFNSTWENAAARHATMENQWLKHQLDGTFRSSARFILTQGAWRFALKTETLTPGGTPMVGYVNAFQKPTDWLMTHAIYLTGGTHEQPIDVREHEERWSSDQATITVRYLSDETLDDPRNWPEAFLRCVGSHLGLNMGDGGVTTDSEGRQQQSVIWPDYVAKSLQDYGVAPNRWLKHQLDGSFSAGIRQMINEQDWRFATTRVESTTTTESTLGAYTWAHTLPSDLGVITRIYETYYDQDEYDHPFRLTGNIMHTDRETVTIEYINTTTINDSTQWPEYFDTALIDWLNYRAALDEPGTPGAVIQRRAEAYERSNRKSRTSDDRTERPRVNRTPGGFIRARAGFFGRDDRSDDTL